VRLPQSFSRFLALALFLAIPSSLTWAAAGEVAAPKDQVTTPATAPVKAAIAPHRAIYDMKLASVKNGSNITGVSGKMLFEWADVCDGWAVQQHLQLHFSYAEGDESDVTSTVVSWESKDGKKYNFNVRRISDGKVTDVFSGKGTVGPDGGEVVYTAPADKVVKLAAGTIFPSRHTELLIQNASSGQKLFTRRVFDGSDEEGMDDISAFIGPQNGQLQTAELDPKLKNNQLLSQPSWPVRMAFFKLKTETGEPDYEMNLTLLANGVARDMMLDYGDFSVSGTLSAIEPLSTPAGCQN
jgi:hypothetical protein